MQPASHSRMQPSGSQALARPPQAHILRHVPLTCAQAHRSCSWIACERESCGPEEAIEPGCTVFACRDVLNKRLAKAARLLEKRVAEAELHGTQLIVVSHCKLLTPESLTY